MGSDIYFLNKQTKPLSYPYKTQVLIIAKLAVIPKINHKKVQLYGILLTLVTFLRKKVLILEN